MPHKNKIIEKKVIIIKIDQITLKNIFSMILTQLGLISARIFFLQEINNQCHR